jgi:hypothetical protein
MMHQSIMNRGYNIFSLPRMINQAKGIDLLCVSFYMKKKGKGKRENH